MKRTFRAVILAAFSVMSSVSAIASDGATLFNDGWKFSLNDNPEYAFSDYTTDDKWENVSLPHDWSIELGTVNDPTKSDGATAYFPGGIGWYNKSFDKMIGENQKCYVIFDGVYNNSECWINGKRVGEHPYGYSPFFYDLTDYLRPEGQKNELMVRVDHSHFVDSRWYTGSGIYRNVKLLVVDKLHIPVWGTYVTTPFISEDLATVSMEVKLQNDYAVAKNGVVVTTIMDDDDDVVASVTTPFELGAGCDTTLSQLVDVEDPDLWEIDDPDLYYAKSTIYMDNEELDTRTTRFGFRTIKFDAKKGFFLNGENMKIKGVCLHHDGGLVGAAVPKAVWERRLKALKAAGCNAIRASHNPTSEEFLELCDELGFLVQQEFFDEWDNPKDKRHNMNGSTVCYESLGYTRFFQEWSERDIETTMLRDRNSPSVFQWSIGNEIEWTYSGCREATGFFGADAAGNYFWTEPPYSAERIRKEWESQPESTYDIGETAHRLAAKVREMDLTRPVTANCILPSVSYESGYIDALDVAGFSYRRVMYDYGHRNYPDKPLMGTENLGQWHEWKAVLDRDFVPGIFIWTGIDYLGEMGGNHGTYPDKSKPCGLLDCAGFVTPSYDMIKSLWVDEPVIAIYSQPKDKSMYKYDEAEGKFVDKDASKPWSQRLWYWEDMVAHWNYESGDEVVVELYSNCDEIELFQNGKSLGKKRLEDFEDRIYKWSVTFSEGSIEARGVKDGEKVSTALMTSGEATSIRLTADRSSLDADCADALHVVAQLIDKKGREVKDETKMVKFSVEGDCRVLGVDNGATGNLMPFYGSEVETYEGRCLLIVQAQDKASEVTISASAEGLTSNNITFDIK